MIPDHLIDKAVRAAGENWVLTFEWEHDKLHAQVHAAIEAVAAEIWDQGWDVGRRLQGPNSNPYRNEDA